MVVGYRHKHLDTETPALEDIPRLGHTEENYKVAVEASLRKLDIEYIDLYQLHWPDRYVPTVRSHYEAHTVNAAS